MAIDPIHPYSPVPSTSTERASDSQSRSSEKPLEQVGFQAMGAAAKGEENRSGSDGAQDDSAKSKEAVGDVPFAATAAAQTLAALPPIHPLGTATLTELSLQKMMQPRHDA